MDYVQIGYNFRLPTMCAALGISQLTKIDELIALRRKRGNFYDRNLEGISEIQIFPETEGSRTVYQLYSILLKNPEKRDELQQFLLDYGISTKIYFAPIHLKTYYRKNDIYKNIILPITEEISKKILTIPISLRFKDEDQMYIINKIKSFFE